MATQISIVIVSYNVSSLLRKCLQSVFSQQVIAEVIVVDNNSTDDSLNMIRSEFPQVILIANSYNAGFSEANNQGIKVSSGKYIFLLNPDTELSSDTLYKMNAHAGRITGNFLLGPRLLNSDQTLQISAWKKSTPWSMIAEAFFLRKLFGVAEYPAEKFATEFSPGMISGAALFFPRSLYEQIGGLDPKLFWMEDADFSYRAARAGALIVYDPTATVVHHSGQSAKKNPGVVISNQLLSKLKYYHKHYGRAVMLITSPFCLFHIVSRMVIFGIAGIVSADYATKARAYLFAAGRFFSYLFTADERII